MNKTRARRKQWVNPRMQKLQHVYLQLKAQHKHRKSLGKDPVEFRLSFDDYVAIWGDKFEQRGRTKGSYCFIRKDQTGDWCKENVHVVTRSEAGQLQVKQQWSRKNENLDTLL